eukprot:TRINITY_DN45665_c0_g1_i1.p2 TRINITY_DN45665_c0_g1~~TRINITY_DN45665_c0_g1_i1.p2  ORF type:complete len:125 (+),score=11.23 TRINITY_DN45665_c0_g1_i1:47-376(+)
MERIVHDNHPAHFGIVRIAGPSKQPSTIESRNRCDHLKSMKRVVHENHPRNFDAVLVNFFLRFVASIEVEGHAVQHRYAQNKNIIKHALDVPLRGRHYEDTNERKFKPP